MRLAQLVQRQAHALERVTLHRQPRDFVRRDLGVQPRQRLRTLLRQSLACLGIRVIPQESTRERLPRQPSYDDHVVGGRNHLRHRHTRRFGGA